MARVAKRKTMQIDELHRLAFLNKPPAAIAVLVERRMRWVGVGWIDEGEPKGDEPLIMDGDKKHEHVTTMGRIRNEP